MNFSLRERVTWKGITGMVSYIDPCGEYFILKGPKVSDDYPHIVVFKKYFDEVISEEERRKDNI